MLRMVLFLMLLVFEVMVNLFVMRWLSGCCGGVLRFEC